MRQIHDAAAHERAAVDDAYVHALVVLQVRDSHPGSERQRTVSGGHLLHVVDFTVRGVASMIGMPVPACHARFGCAQSRGCAEAGALLPSTAGEQNPGRGHDAHRLLHLM